MPHQSSKIAKQAPEACANESKPEDVVLVHGQTEDGSGYQVIRKRGESVQAGIVRPIEEGRPLVGDVVKLSPREEFPLLCDVEVLHETGARSGPAQVSNDRYRAGWAAIWGERAESPENLPN